ncbi:hypothetical protein [Microbacterium stercoris]|uniref:Uncharacterized protein n=1 Tax=Microbacterium stercoris TaxID=2820289 RepID=A0A939TM48_9MICO|nr:hypothetical protein [Microbacterium stercoris]MBO3662818.1 hypothetical protein [Microbacterium stercoris]
MSQDQTQPVTETKDAATEAIDNAKERAAEAATQAENDLKGKAGGAQHAVADGLRAAGDKVAALSDTDGVVGDVAEKVSEGLTHASEWVAGRDPESMLTEAKSFAKRKPWVTAGIAVGALLVLNRITRALTGGGRR